MTHFNLYFLFLQFLGFFLNISQAQDNNFVPPILVTCSAVPEDTGGIWNCNPPIIMGYPVHVGTRCNFICNGMIFGEYICSNLGKWNEDPNERTCENGEPTSTSTVISSTGASTTTSITEATTLPTEQSTPPTESSTPPTEPSTPPTESSTPPTELSTTPTEPSTTPTEPSTTPTEPITTSTGTTQPSTSTPKSTTISIEPSTTHQYYENCPFSTTNNWAQDRSLFCPQSYCPAVYIESTGSALQNQPDSIGCFNYEGSLLADEYPIYINSFGRFLTPHAYSNPVIGYTVWLVSDIPMDTNGTIRNNKHDDMLCPYDMLDGWEYRDATTGQWVEDSTMTVKCVKS